MRTIAVAALSILALGGQQPPAKSLSNFDRGASLTMLKQVKIDLKENYYDVAFRGIDVDQVFADAEQKIRNASSVNETIGTIAEVLMRLNDSHTTFLPPDRKLKVTYGWQVSMVGDVPYVVGVLPGSDAEKKGLAPGDRLLAWNRYEPRRENLWQLYYLYNSVRPQQLQRLVVQKPDGTEKTLDIESKLEPREGMDFEDLLDMVMKAIEKTEDRTAVAGDTFVWRYTTFLDPKEVDKAMKKAGASKGLVLDLRGNSGGNIEAMRALVSWLFDRDVHIAVEKTRKGEKPLDAKPRKDAFTGKLVVLVDSRSASAAEMVARVVQLEKRGTVIGDRTAGAVMAARMFPHTVGSIESSLGFYATSITISDLRMSDGASLEHKGLAPDDTVLPSAADLAARRDPVLARAIAMLGGMMTAEEAGRFFRQQRPQVQVYNPAEVSTATLVTLDEIRAARARIRPVAKVTPVVDVSSLAGRPLWLKCEGLQPGGAFKIRGAYNMVAQLSDDERRRGVITYSSGNHGQAVAIAARELGAPAVVVVPTTAPAIKVNGVKSFGAEVVFEGTTSLHRRAKAEALAAARSLTMVPPFDHAWIIAGQGTLGLELLEQCPDVGTVLVPVGGGGLVSGVAAAIKLSRPGVTVIGIEPAGAASMKNSLEHGEVRTLDRTHSIADGLMAVRPGDLNFAHVRKFVDRIDTVDDDEIAAAVRWLFEHATIVAEPSGAATVAAALRDSATYTPPVVAIISGGNISPEDLARYTGQK